jgi:hypothetical protein
MGWTIAAAPRARAYHAFGGFWEPRGRALSRAKLASAVNGRLRFLMLLSEPARTVAVFGCYAREDLANVRSALLGGDLPTLPGYLQGWAKSIVQLPSTRTRRRELRQRRVVSDPVLYDDDLKAPPLLMRGSAPLLTRDVIERVYRPLVEAGLTRLTLEPDERRTRDADSGASAPVAPVRPA